jgi:hypothetical protein
MATPTPYYVPGEPEIIRVKKLNTDHNNLASKLTLDGGDAASNGASSMTVDGGGA